MTTRINLSLHGVTAADLGKLCISSVSGSVSFAIGGVFVFFDGPGQFAAWLVRLQELAAATPQVAAILAAQAAGTRPAEPGMFGLCLAVNDDALLCSLPDGHEGGHAATGWNGREIARWGSRREIARRGSRGPVERAFGHCGERDGNDYTCTEPAGHEGEHVAAGADPADVYARWTS